ncbi:hypothetical protein R9X47_03065 [Wukongibacter baidiensis]|uniref:hypothetical protein n=1 Tax=Wukongibacter baidiensis TaxID=1723361 RepID=UPI003D7FE3C1
MLKRILKSKRGSTLLLVLVTLSILSILGTAIISLSVINYKMKIVDKNIKTSFYLAEAGLEEAYAVIGKEIEAGIESGNTEVKNNLSDFIRRERAKEAFDPPEDTELDDSVFIIGNHGYGEVNEEKIKPLMEEWFRLGFSKYMNDNLQANLEIKNDNDEYGIVDGSIDDDNAGVKVEDAVEFKIENDSISVDSNGRPSDAVEMDNKTDEPIPYEITLLSSFEHEKITKKVKGRFSIKIPKYNASYYVKNVKAKLAENILWKKAITTENNLYVTGENVEVNGDIYAYGTIPTDKKDSRNYGGVVVGDKDRKINGKVTINGDVVTNSYLHTNADNSSININGNVYCNSLVIQDGTSGSTITVGSTSDDDYSVNTADDIELNGEKARIEINGSYYGFSDGRNSDTAHHESSSIVINSEDIGTESFLKVTKEIFMGGTVYINLPIEDYQTGESVSIKGNYKAYSEVLSGIDDDLDTPEEDESKYNNLEPEIFQPLVLVNKLKDETKTEMNAIEKSKYFYYYNQAHSEADDPERLQLGGSSGIDINTNDGHVLFSTGAYLSNGVIYPSKPFVDNDYMFNTKSEEYEKHVNNMSDEIESDTGKKVHIRDADGAQYGRFSFDENIYINEDLKIGEGVAEKIIKEVVFINDDANKDLYIIGQYGDSSGIGNDDEKIDISSANIGGLKGIIVTKGKVYLRGRLSYRGTISAVGNIYIEDDNIKTITNDENYIYKTVYEDKIEDSGSLANQFVNNGDEVSFLYESEAGADDLNSYLKYEDVVDVYWERVK